MNGTLVLFEIAGYDRPSTNHDSLIRIVNVVEGRILVETKCAWMNLHKGGVDHQFRIGNTDRK